MVARSLPPQPALPGKAARSLRHLRRRTRTPLLHPAPSSNPVAEVLELGMLTGDAGPLPHTPDCRPLAGDATSQAGAHADPKKREANILCRLLAQLGIRRGWPWPWPWPWRRWKFPSPRRSSPRIQIWTGEG